MKLQRYICKKLIDTGEHTASLLNIVKKKQNNNIMSLPLIFSYQFFISLVEELYELMKYYFFKKNG